MDRQILGILAPDLQRELGWSELQYGHIVSAFQGAYALGLLLCGWIVDRLGTRLGLLLAVTCWSLVSMAHGLAQTAAHFAYARFGLGLAEAGNFPASVKSVAEWFPKHERALAIGIFNSGSNLGAVVAPLVVPYVAITFGWRYAFYVLGFIGFIWVVAALVFFRAPKRIPEASQSSSPCPVKPHTWREVVCRRETWAFAVAKFLTDPIWWFYLYWTPKYLHSSFGVELMSMGLPLVVIYLCADLGSIGGGWWTGRLMQRGLAGSEARMRVMLRFAVLVLAVIGLVKADNLFSAVALLSLAVAIHQGWSANLFATVSDTVPREAVASVVGIGGMAGALGGVLFAQGTGHILQLTGSYLPLFVVCGSAYLLAWVSMRVLSARVA